MLPSQGFQRHGCSTHQVALSHTPTVRFGLLVYLSLDVHWAFRSVVYRRVVPHTRWRFPTHQQCRLVHWYITRLMFNASRTDSFRMAHWATLYSNHFHTHQERGLVYWYTARLIFTGSRTDSFINGPLCYFLFQPLFHNWFNFPHTKSGV